MGRLLTRRKLLGLAAGAAACGCGVVVACPLAGYLIPTRVRRRRGPVAVAKVGDLGSTALTVPYEGRMAILVRQGSALRAFDAECTHLGCLVEWNVTEKNFRCPCHGGLFDANGQVLAGPPPRPLIEIPAKLRGDRIYLSPENGS